MTRHVDAYRIDVDTPFQRFVSEPSGLEGLNLGVTLHGGRPVLSDSHPIIIYRYPTMNDNTRTLIATALPYEGFLYSKGYVHGLRTPGATPEDVLALLGYMNTFLCDWWLRRFVDRHITLPVLSNLPLPDWAADTRRRVATLASDLLQRAGVRRLAGGHRLTIDRQVRQLSRPGVLAELEHHALRGFGLEISAWEAVLEDFSDDACSDELRRAVRGEAPS